ncbi:MAG TPA: DNA polymerase III subunit gamma/tau [Candidatus Aphodousia faecigallinarum]|uniref:DNA polymerase III subunit gamma/tau n=1 Tax=Candidatus Aphodousia faecigallinarum TaxID=2840677 RepID=A0A9D1LFS2_9BURK|nr:DNA polymerase III subunit gamma/tau [Candidatus Aphodousia faecigallinarum]
MASQVLARKWRPHDFESVVGQEPVVQALTHALRENRLHHAYLFTGTRGVGKTTLSRILAKSLNCVGPDGKGGVTDYPCGVCEACRAIDEGRFVDYIEMDAASNRSVEEMTALLEQAMYAPTNARYKVYMIDEVHQLTSHAFNAMLKTLEEPPEYVKFILATTDPQKVPVTVLSRCLQFNLKNVSPQTVADHMAHILKEEKIEAEPAALKLLGVGARGSMRDGLSLLDQAIAFAGDKPITLESVREMLGMMDSDVLIKLLGYLAEGKAHEMMQVAEQMSMRSLSFSQAIRDLASILHKIALAQFDVASLASDDMDRDSVIALARTFTPQEVQLYYQIALNARGDMNLAPDEYAGFTMALLRMLAFKPAGSVQVKLPERFKPQTPKEVQASEPMQTVAAKKVETSTIPEPQKSEKKESEPAPWEDAPLGESDSGSREAVAPKEVKAPEKAIEPAAQLDDDVPYVDSYDEYATQMEPSIDDYGFEPMTFNVEQKAKEPEAESSFESRYDFAEDYEEIPEFSEVGRRWFEMLRYTYPATYAKDILERSECVSIKDDLITLRIDPLYENRLSNQKAMLSVQRIVDPLFGRRMRFEFELGTPRSRTISQEKARLKKEKLQAEEAERKKNKFVTITDEAERKEAIDALKQTPLARTVMRRFNARIDPMSVKKKVS